MSTQPSGWCAPGPPGAAPAQQHEECQRRLDAGLLGECGCDGHKGDG